MAKRSSLNSEHRLLSRQAVELLFREDVASQLDMCSKDVQSSFEFEEQEVTPLRQVQLQEQKQGQSAELINCAAYVIQALSSLCQTLIMCFQWEM